MANTLASAPTSTPVHHCYLCSHATSVTLSHVVSGRQYAYVWCIRCAFGQYVNLY